MRILKFVSVVALVGALALSIFLAFRGKYMLRVATGSVSLSLCGATFISNLDPDMVFAFEQRPLMSQLAWAIRYSIDRTHGEVRATTLGFFESRAVFRAGLGCMLMHDEEAVPEPEGLKLLASTAPLESAPIIEPTSPALRAALIDAFAEPDLAHLRHTMAVVVMHDGKIIAERYAPGIGRNTPLHVHSISKSITSALIGILVREDKLRLKQPVPLRAWHSPKDPRHAITIDNLLRMSSGLPFDETASVLSPANRMWLLERDSAVFAERADLAHPVGTQWGYSNLGYQLLSRFVRDAAGARCVEAQRFIQRELFEPVGMSSAVVDCDTVGTPLGSSHLYASARDIARFGQLYLDDGVVDGKRILPEGWVQYSASQTLNTGYGAGFWTNLVSEGSVPVWDAPWGMLQLPKDMFYARGYLGQYLIIIPSERLVVARIGMTQIDARAGIADATASIIAALHAPAEKIPNP